MKTQIPATNPLALVTCALVLRTVNLHAQSAPSIITQPASQTNGTGTSTSFNLTAVGIGPSNHQWRPNGTNLPNTITVAENGSANSTPGTAELPRTPQSDSDL